MTLVIDVRGISRHFAAPFSPAPSLPTQGLGAGLRGFIRRRHDTRPPVAPFRALDNVSFSIRKGEVVGLIGRNGAGKSTLLKILSRILRPTSGEIDVYGHIGSLLEVGTGFHPDLSGRENVFLNGALLGLKRRQIEARFDAITDFAEIGDFIDAPLKHYSSGMYLRLAFAVAIHLDAEVLLLDEVLSVGDEWFRRKCLNRIEEACRSGRTVLIVGHDLSTLGALCDRILLLDHGRLIADGPPSAVIERYLALHNDSGAVPAA